MITHCHSCHSWQSHHVDTMWTPGNGYEVRVIGSTWSQLFPAGPVNGYPFGLIEKKDAK